MPTSSLAVCCRNWQQGGRTVEDFVKWAVFCVRTDIVCKKGERKALKHLDTPDTIKIQWCRVWDNNLRNNPSFQQHPAEWSVCVLHVTTSTVWYDGWKKDWVIPWDSCLNHSFVLIKEENIPYLNRWVKEFPFIWRLTIFQLKVDACSTVFRTKIFWLQSHFSDLGIADDSYHDKITPGGVPRIGDTTEHMPTFIQRRVGSTRISPAQLLTLSPV